MKNVLCLRTLQVLCKITLQARVRVQTIRRDITTIPAHHHSRNLRPICRRRIKQHGHIHVVEQGTHIHAGKHGTHVHVSKHGTHVDAGKHGAHVHTVKHGTHVHIPKIKIQPAHIQTAQIQPTQIQTAQIQRREVHGVHQLVHVKQFVHHIVVYLEKVGKIQGKVFSELLAGQYIDIRMSQLILYHVALRRHLGHMLDERSRVVDAIGQDRRGGILFCPHHAHDGQVFPVSHQLAHVTLIIPLIGPDIILFIIFIVVRSVYQFIGGPDHVLIEIHALVFHVRDFTAVHGFVDQVFVLIEIFEPQGIDHIVCHAPQGGNNENALVVFLRPSPGHDIIGIDIKILVFR